MAFEYYLLAKSHLQWIQSLEITSWKNIWFSVLTQNGSFSDEQNWKNFICWPNKGSIYLKFAFRHPICYNNYVGFFIHVLYPQNIYWQIFVSDHVFFSFWNMAIMSQCCKSTLSGCDFQPFLIFLGDLAGNTPMSRHKKHKIAKIDNIKLILPSQKWD